jgi:hypothetical protein
MDAASLGSLERRYEAGSNDGTAMPPSWTRDQSKTPSYGTATCHHGTLSARATDRQGDRDVAACYGRGSF